MEITFDLMEYKFGDFEINMLPLGKFLSTGLVNVYLLTLINLNPY